MKLFLCIIILVMPDGSANIHSKLVETCPEQRSVQGYFNAQKEQGHIRGWYGVCIETPLGAGERT